MNGLPSARKTIANRKNAQKSTGPKTEQGKATVSQNATKHGLTASEMHCEDDLDLNLDEYKESLLKAYKPKGPAEEEVVSRIIAQSWRLRRVNKTDTGIYRTWNENEKVETPTTHGQFLKAKTFDTLGRYERAIHRSLHRDIEHLRTLQTERKAP